MITSLKCSSLINTRKDYSLNKFLNFKAKMPIMKKDIFVKSNIGLLTAGSCIIGLNEVESKGNIEQEEFPTMKTKRNDKAIKLLLENIDEIEYASVEENVCEDDATDIPHVEYSYYDENERLRKLEKFYNNGSVLVEIYDEDDQYTFIGSINKFRLDSFFTCSKKQYDHTLDKVIKQEQFKLDNDFNII